MSIKIIHHQTSIAHGDSHQHRITNICLDVCKLFFANDVFASRTKAFSFSSNMAIPINRIRRPSPAVAVTPYSHPLAEQPTRDNRPDPRDERLVQPRPCSTFPPGTSSGGVLALGLALGFPATDLLNHWQEWWPRVFKRHRGLAGLWASYLSLFRPRHAVEPLARAVRLIFGDRRLRDSRVRLVIPAFDVTAGRTHIFQTPHLAWELGDPDVRASDVALDHPG